MSSSHEPKLIFTSSTYAASAAGAVISSAETDDNTNFQETYRRHTNYIGPFSAYMRIFHSGHSMLTIRDILKARAKDNPVGTSYLTLRACAPNFVPK